MPDSAPTIDFSTFVLSMASSVMFHLGRLPDPTGETQQPALGLARQSIDILAMLKDKTRGNLDADEAQLLDRVLHDSRMAFVEESRNQAS